MTESKTNDIRKHNVILMSKERREQMLWINERFFDVYECQDCEYAILKTQGGHKK